MTNAAGRIVKWFGTCTDIDDLKHAQEEQRRSLQEKEILLKEVHHRVKNSLQVICSLLSMQLANSPDSFSSPLNDAYSRIQAMALIHEEIYQSDTLAHLDLSTYIEVLSARLFDVYCIDQSRIRLELSLEPVQMTLDDAIPCGLVLNELLSNSLKHAFPGGRGGVIRISLKSIEGGRVELQVADNGIGLPVDFRMDETKSLGLQVVQVLIAQLGADLFVSGDAGATFRFSWKLAEPRNPSEATPRSARV
jgi:two-component sensor histidine kinase